MYDGIIKGKFDSTGATLLSMCGFLSIHTNVFLVVNQPDEKHDEEIETPDEEKENLFSSSSTTVFSMKNIHTTVFLGKKALPPSFLMDSVEENCCVYEASQSDQYSWATPKRCTFVMRFFVIKTFLDVV